MQKKFLKKQVCLNGILVESGQAIGFFWWKRMKSSFCTQMHIPKPNNTESQIKAKPIPFGRRFSVISIVMTDNNNDLSLLWKWYSVMLQCNTRVDATAPIAFCPLIFYLDENGNVMAIFFNLALWCHCKYKNSLSDIVFANLASFQARKHRAPTHASFCGQRARKVRGEWDQHGMWTGRPLAAVAERGKG